MHIAFFFFDIWYKGLQCFWWAMDLFLIKRNPVFIYIRLWQTIRKIMDRPLEEHLKKVCSFQAPCRSQIPLHGIRSDLPLSKQICFVAIPDFQKPCHRQTDEQLAFTATDAFHIETAIKQQQKGQQPTMYRWSVIRLPRTPSGETIVFALFYYEIPIGDFILFLVFLLFFFFFFLISYWFYKPEKKNRLVERVKGYQITEN